MCGSRLKRANPSRNLRNNVRRAARIIPVAPPLDSDCSHLRQQPPSLIQVTTDIEQRISNYQPMIA